MRQSRFDQLLHLTLPCLPVTPNIPITAPAGALSCAVPFWCRAPALTLGRLGHVSLSPICADRTPGATATAGAELAVISRPAPPRPAAFRDTSDMGERGFRQLKRHDDVRCGLA